MTALAAFFESYYRRRPVNATFTGVHDYDDCLPDWSPEGLACAADEMRAQRAAIRPDGALHDVGARDRALAGSFLNVEIAEHDSGHFQHRNPSLAAGEAIFSALALMTRPFAPVDERAAAATARLLAMRAFLAGARQTITHAVPDEWRIRALRECDGADRLFGNGVRRWCAVEAIPHGRAERLVSAADRARAAFAEFRLWLERDVRSSPDGYGCGPALFDDLMEHGHWCSRPRAALAEEARAALDEALARVDERARHISPGGWPELQQRLAKAHPSADEYLSSYQRAWDACRARAEALDLVTWPDYPIRYVPIPPHTRDAAPLLYYLHYRSPAPFDRLPVHEYVVTPIEPEMSPEEQRQRLRAANTSVIKLNHVVHHGAIGHHVQNWYAYAGRSAIGRVAAVDCACRIGMLQGGTMAEGWACYATDVMDEVEFLTPEESVAQQHTRARLLARAVVDIGLHEGSLAFEDAVAIYRDRIGMTPQTARAEACKNSMFPATAIMYWLGTEGLHQLRRERQRVEGTAFILGRFHDRVLSFGSIPVLLLSTVYR